MISNTSRILVALGAVFAASSAMAGGYGVKLQSGLTAGMANAGSGVSDDALAIYANPAAMIQNTTHQVAGNFTGVFGATTFKGTASTSGALQSIPAPAFVPGAVNQTARTKNAAQKVAVPSFGVVANAHDRVKLGVMVHAPYGLKFNYGTDSVVRGHTKHAEMTTISIDPSVAVKIIDALTIGGGLQLQYSKVEFARKVTLTNAGTFGSHYSRVKGDDWSVGWMAGIFSQLTKAWKLGFSYKSKMVANLDGAGQIGTLPGVLASQSIAQAKVYFPHIFTLSTSYDLSKNWTAYADIIYTKWDIVKEIRINTFAPATNTSNSDVIPLRWKNTWFFSLGASYKLNDNWTFRGGYAYDMAPSRNATRVVSIPDTNKHWIAIGTTYNMAKNFGVTLSYGHEFFQSGKVNLSQGPATAANAVTYNKGNLVGKVKNRVDLVSLQFNYKF